jgi:hypothetical protein
VQFSLEQQVLENLGALETNEKIAAFWISEEIACAANACYQQYSPLIWMFLIFRPCFETVPGR